MNYGIDFLGGARYQKTVLAEHPRKFGFGVFAEVDGFGKAYDLIDKVAALGVPFIRVQLQWRDKHDFSSADLKVTENRCKLLLPIIKKHPSVKWYISPICEHNLDQRQFQPFADVVAKYLGGLVQIVNSPNFKKGFVSKEYLNEYHHEEKPRGGGRYAFSFDGANIVDSDIEKYKGNYSNAEYFMLWNSQCNGRRNLTDSTPRQQRKFFPMPKQIDSWVHLVTNSKGATNYPSSFIGKSHSDQHKIPPEGKDQKRVEILPMNVQPDRLHLVAANGQKIATSTKKAPYNEKVNGKVGKQIGWRYYFATEWGFELANRAKRLAGTAICTLLGDNKKLGTVNPAFRDGKYR
jgi:hypothetical protein